MAENEDKLIRNNDLQGYTDANRNIAVICNVKTGEIKKIPREKFKTNELKNFFQNGELVHIDEVINNTSYFKPVTFIVSTTSEAGYIEKADDISIDKLFNVFENSKFFKSAINENPYLNSDLIKALENETPAFNLLLKNLFYNEDKPAIINFLKWLNVSLFENKRQDLIYLFFGTDEHNQAQGSGKNVLFDVLRFIAEDLVQMLSSSQYRSNFNAIISGKLIVGIDEMPLGDFDYPRLKNLVGDEKINIERKGQDLEKVDNIISLMIFSNEHKIDKQVSKQDRRLVMIRPRGEMRSLNFTLDESGLFNGCMKKMYAELKCEVEKILKIIYAAGSDIDISEILNTNARKNYFKEQDQAVLNDLNCVESFFTDKKNLLKMEESLRDLNIKYNETYYQLVSSGICNYRIYIYFYQLLVKNKISLPSRSEQVSWLRYKENAIKKGFHTKTLKFNETKKYKVYQEKVVIYEKKLSKTQQRILNSKLRDLFGIKKED